VKRAGARHPGRGWIWRLLAGLAAVGVLIGCAAPGSPPAPDPFLPVNVPDACRDFLNPTYVSSDCR
jgi:hypothetical protein